MTEKRFHHYVPRFYLRGFTDPRTPSGKTPWLWVHEKGATSLFRRAPGNIAAEIGFYALESDGAVDYTTVENELATMESRAAFALRRFLDGPVGDRKVEHDLAAFFGWLAARVPWFCRAAEERWARFLQDAAAGQEQVPDDPGFRCTVIHAETGDRKVLSLPEALSAIASGSWRPSLQRNQLIEAMRAQAWYFRFEHFSRLHWTLLTAPADHFFLTSDRPVVWFRPGSGFADSPAALKDPDVELTVPVSRRYAFLATALPPAAGTVIRPADINRRTFLFSERFVASPREDEIWEQPHNNEMHLTGSAIARRRGPRK